MMNNDELDDILDDPMFDISKDEEQLFNIPSFIRDNKERNEADYVAQRKPCVNFSDFSDGFAEVLDSLRKGGRVLKKYSEANLKEGAYYIVGGQLVFLEKIHSLTKWKKAHQHDGRTRVIYDDGTESDILVGTLRKNLYMDGYLVTENSDEDDKVFKEKFSLCEGDHQDGWIYVLQSLSQNPEIANVKNLYKIGFSTTPVKQRIQNASYEPTYLMDDVRIIRTWRIYNANTHQVEKLIHKFLSSVQFQVEVHDIDGKLHTPTEWFVVPLSIIERSIQMIVDGSIVNYCYNPQMGALEALKQKENDESQFDTTGMDILNLIIKKKYLEEIVSGNKSIEYRQLKPSTMGKYTWVEKETGDRYLRKYDALRLRTTRDTSGEWILVQVTDIVFNKLTWCVEFHLGEIYDKKRINK